MRIRLLIIGTVAATAALLGVTVDAVSGLRDGVTVMRSSAAPEVTATTNLYFEINAMDADVANSLLVGDGDGLAGSAKGEPAATTAASASADYQHQRVLADRDLRIAIDLAAGSASGRDEARELLDGLGSYEALVAEVLLLDHPTPAMGGAQAPPGRPPVASLRLYEQATDVMHQQVLPAARALTAAGADTLDTTYADTRSGALTARVWVLALGVLVAMTLLVFQMWLARAFRRRLSPALAAATLLAIGLTTAATMLLSGEATQLRVAKSAAFESILALSRARAVSYDANAYESRWLVDPGRAGEYQDAFLTESQQLVDLRGASLGTYDARLAAALDAYRSDHDDVEFSGFFGTELRNITFPGERAAAERTLAAYQVYERDDRRLRAMANAGESTRAISFDIGTSPGESDAAFTRYDAALTSLIGINQRAFDAATAAAGGELAGWDLIPVLMALAVVLLTALGAWPRLAEYR
jgi:hypothetical protein